MKRNQPESSGTAPARRRQDQTLRERTFLSLQADVLDSAKQIVRAGGAETLSAYVEAAIEEKVHRDKQAALYAAYALAAQDAEFSNDASAVAEEFSAGDRDGL